MIQILFYSRNISPLIYAFLGIMCQELPSLGGGINITFISLMSATLLSGLAIITGLILAMTLHTIAIANFVLASSCCGLALSMLSGVYVYLDFKGYVFQAQSACSPEIIETKIKLANAADSLIEQINHSPYSATFYKNQIDTPLPALLIPEVQAQHANQGPVI